MTISLLTVITALGWAGALAGLIAYGMVSKGRWTASSFAFQITNMCGAVVMTVVAGVNGVWPSAAANLAWIVIGAQTLLTVSKARAAARREQEDALRVESAAQVDLAA
ncbi:hypothetical protein [Isoptericola sp. NPDC057191]|uniref:CBU_0592 family membrane protein n=1 Tax=Isoptericola sp. NPDC057191 TaxID=3346041 RepID=UPI00362F71B6